MPWATKYVIQSIMIIQYSSICLFFYLKFNVFIFNAMALLFFEQLMYMCDLFKIRNCCFLFDEKNWTQTNRNDITCYWLNKENQSEIESIFELYILLLLRARKSGNKTTWIAKKNVIMLLPPTAIRNCAVHIGVVGIFIYLPKKLDVRQRLIII